MVHPLQAPLPPLGEDVRPDLAQAASEMLAALQVHGAGEDGSVTRLAYSAEWQAAMKEVESWFESYGLETEVDAVGNRFGKLAGDEPGLVMSGSHIDSVRNGGAYDGALGVVMATCAVGWLGRFSGRPRRSLAALASCEEESSRFAGNFWGTRAMLGLTDPDEASVVRDADGVTIGEAMEACGLDPGRIAEARRSDLVAFIEPHIEQGPRLESSGAQLGIVEAVVGVRQIDFSFEGNSGHAGTIPMEDRRDALAAAAEFVSSTRRVALDTANGAVATVGALAVRPGGANQIPGQAALTVDFRHADGAGLEEMERNLLRRAHDASDRHLVRLSTRARLSQDPVTLDERLRRIVERSCREVGRPFLTLASGAGHEAQLAARYIPAAMLFVPSKGGRSHRPDEQTELEDIVTGIEVLIRTLYRLAYEEA